MAGVIQRFESASKPGCFYEVQRAGDGSLYCSCPKWKFQKGVDPKDRKCKHILMVEYDEKLKASNQATTGIPPSPSGVSVKEILEKQPKPQPKPTKSKAPRRNGAYWKV